MISLFRLSSFYTVKQTKDCGLTVLLDVIIWELYAQINYHIETISSVLYSSNLSGHRRGTSKVVLLYHQEQAAEILKSQGYRMGLCHAPKAIIKHFMRYSGANQYSEEAMGACY